MQKTILSLAVTATFAFVSNLTQAAETFSSDTSLDSGEIVWSGSSVIQEGVEVTGNDTDVTFQNGNPSLTNNGYLSVKNLNTFGGTQGFVNNGKIQVTECFSSSARSENNGTIDTQSIGSRSQTTRNELTNNGLVIVHDGKLSNITWTNKGAIKVDKDVTVEVSGTLIFEGTGKLTTTSEEVVDVVLLEGALISNKSSNLHLKSLTSEGPLHTNFNQLGGALVVDGDFQVTNLGLSGGSIDVKGEIDVVGYLGADNGTLKAGSISLGSSDIKGSAQVETEHLTVNSTLYVKNGGGENWKVEEVLLKNHYIGFEAGEYALGTIVMDSAGEQAVNLTAVGADISVNNLVVKEGTVGGVGFYSPKPDGQSEQVKIENLVVEDNSGFNIGSQKGAENHALNIGKATFGENAQITESAKEDNSATHTTIDNAVVNGINVSKMSDDSTFSIGSMTVASGENTFVQPIVGKKTDGKTQMNVVVDKGASASFEKLDTTDLSVELKTLEKDALVSAGTTAENVSIVVDGSENNANQEKVLAKFQEAIKLNTSSETEIKATIGEGGVASSYELQLKGDEIVSVKETGNNKLDAFGSVNSLTTFLWRHSTNDLTKRMGELRTSPEGVGAWVRLYGSEQEYGAQNVAAKNTTIQVGSDFDVGSGWKVGAAFSYTDGTATYDNGDADNKAYDMGVYGTWFADNGQFVDLIAKYSRLESDFQLGGMNGSFDNNAFSISAEYGWHFNLTDLAFIEPQAELTYGRIMGDDITTSNQVTINQDDVDSLIGRVGVRTGFYFPNNKGVIYARASVLHDFEGEVKSRASQGEVSRQLKDDLGGTWFEIGLGANFNWTNNTYSYVDLERTDGGEVKESWRWNVGVRHVF